MTKPLLGDMMAAARNVVRGLEEAKGFFGGLGPAGETKLAVMRAVLDTLQQHERAMRVVDAARDLLRYAGIKHPSSDTIVASRERAIALEAALAALGTAAPETPTDMSPSPERGDV